jgi:parvulin-like peptidyl-prolyl isomerase
MKVFPRLLSLAVAACLGTGCSRHSEPIVAKVSGYPITRSQLDRAVEEQLWLEGKSAADLSAAELKTARESALNALIDHALLRLRMRVDPIAVSESEVSNRLQLLESRFGGKDALKTAMMRQGPGNEQNLRARLAARIQQEKFVERSIAPSIAVSEQEARKWFEENPQAVALPERVEARHIFIPTLDHPPEEARKTIDEALVALTENKKDFATLAKEISKDPATKDQGGALGWMTRERLPADFSYPLFALEMNKPSAIRTKLGWHLVEVTGRKSAEPRDFNQAKAEIVSALEAVKRRQAVADFQKSLRSSTTIEILPATVAN